MSKLLALLVLGFALTGCGIVEQQMCGPLDMDAGCNAFFGPQTDKQESNEQRLAALESQVAELASNYSYLMNLQGNTEESLVALQTQVNSTLVQLVSLQAQVNGMQPGTQVSLRDPCPQVSSNDPKEMLVVIGNKTIAYFEDGGKRFLTQLQTGILYRTTDRRACTFSL